MTRLAVGLLLTCVLISGLCGCSSNEGQVVRITNPYSDVDWSKCGQYKGDFHVHTIRSDGNVPPATAVEKYQGFGFKVLAITDHNVVTFPWSQFGKDPAQLGMVPVQGCELSIHDHMNSLFCDACMTLTERESLVEVGARGGLIIFNHPYWSGSGKLRDPAWYLPFYREYEHLIGMEIIDPTAWDYCLTKLMPDRPIWGFSNSDSHDVSAYNRVWSTLLLESLNEAQVRKALQKGEFYACASGKGAAPPSVQSVCVDQGSKTIMIEARDYARIEWIANGKLVHQGTSLDCRTLPADATYVRAQLVGANTWTRLNPFGIVRGGAKPVAHARQGQAYWIAEREKLRQESLARIAKNWGHVYPLAAKAAPGQLQPLDLSASANRPLTGPEGFLGKLVPGPVGNLYHVQPGRRAIQGVPFDVLDQNANGGRALICLRSKTLAESLGKPNPDSVTLPVGRRCQALYVLHGGTYISEHEKIGQYSFVYADGTQEAVDIIPPGKPGPRPDLRARMARSNIQDWWPTNEQFENPHARKVIVAKADNPLDIRYLYTLQWVNPHPEKEVAAVRLASVPDGNAGLMILAVTAQGVGK